MLSLEIYPSLHCVVYTVTYHRAVTPFHPIGLCTALWLGFAIIESREVQLSELHVVFNKIGVAAAAAV